MVITILLTENSIDFGEHSFFSKRLSSGLMSWSLVDSWGCRVNGVMVGGGGFSCLEGFIWVYDSKPTYLYI